MKNFKKLFIFPAFFFFLIQTASSQWQTCGNYTGWVLSFVVTNNVLVAGTYGSGAYYTSNGTNWTYSASGMTDPKIISMTLNGNDIYAGSEAGGVYRSTDNGINWTPVNNGLTSFEIHTLCSNAGNVYAGTNTGVFMTTNDGNNWQLISVPSVGYTIFALTAYNNKIISASANGVFITTNSGVNWNNITSGTSSYIYTMTNFNNAVYSGSSAQGVYKTTNDGLNWIHLNSGLPGGKAVRGIFCKTEKIFAAVYNNGGIYYLPSSGSSWIPANEGLTQLTCLMVIPFNNYIFAGTSSGIFRRPESEFSSIIKIGQQIPDEYRLFNNYPNPFNPATKIRFDIPENFKFKISNLKLVVYDILGKEIETLVNGSLNPGTYEVNWNASQIPSGIYFYRLETDNFSETKKMLLIK